MRVPEHEDYMHFNTLSMVGSDGRESRRGRSPSVATGMRRNRSWVATLKDLTVGDRSDGRNPLVTEATNSPQRLRLRRSTPSLKGLSNDVFAAPQQTLGLTPLKAEPEPSNSERVPSRSKTLPESQSATATGHCRELSAKGEGSEQIDVDSSANPNLAHIRFTATKPGDPSEDQDENHEPSIGRGRLTMTSRTGYFQDRTIPPSMVGFSPVSFRQSSLGYRTPDGLWLRCVPWQYCIFRTEIQISARITKYPQL